MTTYVAFTPAGTERHHVRLPGKVIWWRQPDGTPGLGGVRLAELLPWRSEALQHVALEIPVMVTEGEPPAAALGAIGIPAIATFGTSAVPDVATLRAIAPRRTFVLWPDEDEAGQIHMLGVAANLHVAGAAAVFMLSYRPSTGPRWPAKHDAADFVGAVDDPELARLTVAWLVEEWTLPIPRISKKSNEKARRNRFVRVDSSLFSDGSVSEALRRHGLERAAAGRTVRCPRHDDRHASLSILADDRRAICKSPTCSWASPGVTAHDIVVGR